MYVCVCVRTCESVCFVLCVCVCVCVCVVFSACPVPGQCRLPSRRLEEYSEVLWFDILRGRQVFGSCKKRPVQKVAYVAA